VFDLCDIAIYHGWIISKQDTNAMEAFGSLSYNQVVERLIAMHEVQQKQREASEKNEGTDLGAEDTKTLEQGMLIQDFLDRTASQLSYDGLLALHEDVRDRQLAVFFRNSHFNAMLKYDGDLYLLCTDIAFAHSHIVWEKLDEVDGDTSYCDAQFAVNAAQSDEAAALAAAQAAQDSFVAAAAGGGADADAMLAMQLMQEDLQAQQAAGLIQQPHLPQGGPSPQPRQPQPADNAAAGPPSAGGPPSQQPQQVPVVRSKQCCVLQ